MKLSNNIIQNNKNIQLIDEIPVVDFDSLSLQYFRHNLEYDLISDRLEISTDYTYSSFLFKNLQERNVPFIKLIPKIKHVSSDKQIPNILVNNFYYTWNKTSEFNYYLNCKSLIYLRESGNFEQIYFTLSVFIKPFLNIKNSNLSRI